MSGGYTSEQVDAIAGWLSEGLTASQIVSVFCRTFGEDRSRNAIIGIVHRNKRLAAIGLAGRGERSEKQKAAAARQKIVEKRQVRRAVVPAKPVVAPQPPKRVDAAAKTLADLAWSECRWPVNDAAPGEQHLFCAAPRGNGPYCPFHARQAGAGYGGAGLLINPRQRAA